MIDLILLGLAVAAISMTITKTHIFKGGRDKIAKLGQWPETLFRCPWCLSHWIAGVIVPLRLELTGFMDWLVLTMATVAISGIASAVITYFFLALDALEGE